MYRFKKYRKEIIISLITGIFLFYVQPALDFLGSVFVKTFVLISDTFSNQYYTSIALNDTNSSSDWSSFLLNIMMSIILIGTILFIREKRRNLSNKISKTLREIAKNKNKIKGTEIGAEKSKEGLLEELQSLEERALQLSESLTKRDNKQLVIYILGFFFVVLLFTNYAITKSVSSENITFRNDILKIAPFSSDLEIKQIQAKWAMMKNQKDYIEATRIVTEIKENNKIK